jgi:hypothetical protein
MSDIIVLVILLYLLGALGFICLDSIAFCGGNIRALTLVASLVWPISIPLLGVLVVIAYIMSHGEGLI